MSRDALIALTLPPGAVVSRAAIAARLGVSQTPVREALIRLQAEGLIAVVPHSATRVTRIDLASAREASFLRLSIELEIVRRLAATPDAGLAAGLRAEVATDARLPCRRRPGRLRRRGRGLPRGALCGGGGAGLRDLVRGRSGHLDRLRRLHLPAPGKADAVLGDHAALAEAIIGGNGAEAEALLRQHLSGTSAEVKAIRAATPDFL